MGPVGHLKQKHISYTQLLGSWLEKGPTHVKSVLMVIHEMQIGPSALDPEHISAAWDCHVKQGF